MTPFIRLHPNDDVLIARSQLVGGSTVEGVGPTRSTSASTSCIFALYATTFG